jgi:hypothetical protein
LVAKYVPPRVARYNVADYTESGNNQNINLRMPEEPKEVLEKDWVAAAGRDKECSVEVPIRKQHCNCPG